MQRDSERAEVRELVKEMTDVLEMVAAQFRREAARRARDIRAALKDGASQPAKTTNGHALEGLRGAERKAALRAMLRHGGLPQHAQHIAGLAPADDSDEELE